MAADTIVARFWEGVRSHPDRVALRHKDAGVWKDITWAEYGETVRRAANGLLATGFQPFDKMALLCRNRPEWFFADLACMCARGTTAPIYVTSSPEQVAYVIGHSDSKMAVVENEDELQKVLKMRADLPGLQRIILIDGSSGEEGDFVLTWGELLRAGDSGIADVASAAKPEDVATFVYTSGTTGPPKAVMLTHSNIWWTCTHSEQHIPIGGGGSARALSYLPLSHIAERMVSHLLQIYYGTQTWFGSVESLLADLRDCRPTYFFGVPRVWEKFFGRIQTRISANPKDLKLRLATKAIEVGKRVTEAEQQAVARGEKTTDARIPLSLKARHAVLDKLVLHRIRTAMGLGDCRLPLSAAAPINPELVWFFHSIGLKIAEGYGQSEDCGPTTWNPADAVRIGTVGTPLLGIELKLAEDGEILVKGGNVTPGYYKDGDETRELLDVDGWMHSGDIGRLDENGYLAITDRKKDLIITAGGKNIAPQEIENRIKLHELVSQAVVIGDRRPFLTALITLDEGDAPAWAARYGVATVGDDRTLAELDGALEAVNASLSKAEGVKKFRVLDRDFLQEEDEVTPTLKVKRKRINEIYAEVIEDMYDDDSPSAGWARAPQRK
jgi:long-chain acyl-CoA synthetase